MTANEITSHLLIEIPKRFKARVWRNNRVNVMAPGHGGKMRKVSAGIDGQADISGIIWPGWRLEIEVKGPRDHQSPVQKAFQSMIREHGGIYMVATDVEGVLSDLQACQECSPVTFHALRMNPTSSTLTKPGV